MQHFLLQEGGGAHVLGIIQKHTPDLRKLSWTQRKQYEKESEFNSKSLFIFGVVMGLVRPISYGPTISLGYGLTQLELFLLPPSSSTLNFSHCFILSLFSFYPTSSIQGKKNFPLFTGQNRLTTDRLFFLLQENKRSYIFLNNFYLPLV